VLLLLGCTLHTILIAVVSPVAILIKSLRVVAAIIVEVCHLNHLPYAGLMLGYIIL
jgi:hypothetical protein